MNDEKVKAVTDFQQELITELKTECKFEKAKIYYIAEKIEKYKVLFNDTLDGFRIQQTTQDYNAFVKALYDSYIEMRLMRNSYLEVLKQILLYGNINMYRCLFNIFEKCDEYYKPKSNQRSYHQDDFGNFYLFFFELALCNLALLMRFNETECIKYTMGHTFINDQDYDVGYKMLREHSFLTIFEKIELKIDYITNYYKYIKGKQDINALAEILEEDVNNEINFSDIIQADLLMHYYRSGKERAKQYVPHLITHIRYSDLKYFHNLIYKENSNNILYIFEKETIEELLEYLNNGNKLREEMRYYCGHIPNLTDIIRGEFFGITI